MGPLRGVWWIPEAGPHGCWLGTYEHQLQRTIKRLLKAGDTFFDVGANAGFYTLLAARLVGDHGRVVAIEPLPANLHRLQQHLSLNAVHNAVVVAAAAAESSGSGHLAEAESPLMGSLAPTGVAVAIRALDDLVEELPTAAPHLIKIDVEGAESRVLDGARELLARHQPAVVLSAHGWRQEERCRATLVEVGYQCRVLKDGTADGDYLLLATRRA
jgi:FkbM family methyltransferase